jgi:hypothetical protein
MKVKSGDVVRFHLYGTEVAKLVVDGIGADTDANGPTMVDFEVSPGVPSPFVCRLTDLVPWHGEWTVHLEPVTVVAVGGN